jgi:hypothetical protein
MMRFCFFFFATPARGTSIVLLGVVKPDGRTIVFSALAPEACVMIILRG